MECFGVTRKKKKGNGHFERGFLKKNERERERERVF